MENFPKSSSYLYSRRWLTAMMWFFCFLATLQLMSFYVMSARFYLNFYMYLSGRERIPFQERILPAYLLRGLLHFPVIVATYRHLGGVFNPPERGAFFTVSFFFFCVTGYFCMKLYRAASVYRTLEFLVFPMLLATTAWSYIILVQQNDSYPYDIASLAFFTAGLYFIYTRQYVPLLVTILLGTFNRETAVLLIPVYVIDACYRTGEGLRLAERFDLRKAPWVRAIVLGAIWAAIRLWLRHRFAHNWPENDWEVRQNFHRLGPKHWPAILNVCGYTVPIIVVLRRWLVPGRFASYLLVFPLWFAIMFVVGIIVETRIYGELSAYSAIAVVLMLERYVACLKAGEGGGVMVADDVCP